MRIESAENAAASQRWRRWWSPQALLLLTFASFYFAIGPGDYFSVDEAGVEESAQALVLRRTLDIPIMSDARIGREQSYYSIKGPGVALVSVPFVYVGLWLDDAFGSMNGGALAGPPVGTEEHPLRWSGRLAISTTLIVNALVGGALVAMLFMVGMRLTGNARASILMAVAAGVATTVMSEATHLFQHPLSALMLLVGFWFFARDEPERIERRGLLGGLSLGIAILARPDAAAAAAVLWLYGGVAAWKLVRNFADRIRRVTRWTVLASLGPATSVAGYFYYNSLKFGGVAKFGYTKDWERFRIDPSQISKAIGPFLFSPALSVFLFAPPLILAVVAARWSFRRWPLETGALIAASGAHLLLLACYGSGISVGLGPFAILDVTYGPRFMLEEIVLLMPLTLPAFEAVADLRWRWAVTAVAGVVLLGLIVQLIGVAVYVTVNEWHRGAASAAVRAAYPFVLSESPIVVQLKELLARRNLSPWLIRAFANPGPALVLLWALIVITIEGCCRILEYFRSPQEDAGQLSSDRLPTAIVFAAVMPILAGFAMMRPVTDPPNVRTYELINAGLAAQKAGHAVTAAEDYAVVLGLDSSNKFARYNLGILQQDAGRVPEALRLYQSASRADPNFMPPRLRTMALIRANATK